MAFMAAKCSQCGATIQVDDSTEKGVCPYCGMEYYAEKIINNTYVTNNYSGATINVQGIDVQNYLEIATKFYKQKNYEEAMKYLSDAFPIEPNNKKLWLLKLKILCAKIPTVAETTVNDIVGTLHEIMDCFTSDDIVVIKETLKELYNFHTLCLDECVKINCADYLEKEDKAEKQSEMIQISSTIKDVILSNIILNVSCPHSVIDEFLAMDMENMKKRDIIQGQYYTILGETSLKDSYKELFLPALELRITNRKGEKKEPTYMGTYLVHTIKKVHLGYSSPVLDAAEKLMDSKEKAGCYIATCVYGSYECPQVWTLRRFRDNILAKTWLGRVFIRLYYMISPQLVKYFGGTKWFKYFWKRILDKMVLYFQRKGMDGTPYEDRVC